MAIKLLTTITGGFSPQLMRSVSILRMSAPSLAQFLREHNNPCLRTSRLPPPLPAASEDIRSQLHADCRETPATADMRLLLQWLIECVNDDGFLELPTQLPCPAAEMEAAIAHLQKLAPPGVAARSAAERLLLLLRQQPATPARAAACRLITDHWQWLQRKRWDKLPKRGLTAALTLIESLPPVEVAAAAAAPSLPDVMFIQRRGLWRAAAAVGVKISATAQKSREGTLGDWRQAQEIAAAVAARRRWLLAAAQYAADHQSAFFQDDASALRPLPMKQVAAAMKISPAMLSHIVSGKRAIFAGGEFPLKYLYGSHTQSIVIQYKIKQMIASENPRHPLSDSDLSHMFYQQGMRLARRTVAKHRQRAGIAATALRKRASG